MNEVQIKQGGERMNAEACIKKIEKYLKKSNVGVLVVDVQNSDDLCTILSHFDVSGNTVVSASEYCNNDELPRMDTLFDAIAKKIEPLFLTGLSSFLKLKGENELRNELSDLLAMTISGHVVVLTFQCKQYLSFPDPRLSGRIYIVDGIDDCHRKLVFTSNRLLLPGGVAAVSGINAIAAEIEMKSNASIFVTTEKERKTFPHSLFPISDLKKAFDALTLKDGMTANLDEALGSEADWNYALNKFAKNDSWVSLISSEFCIVENLELIMHNYPSYDSKRKWLFFIGLKLFGAKKNWCLSTAASRARNCTDLAYHAYRDILEIEPTDDNFKECYSSRKKLLNELGNPINDVIAFCKIVISKERSALYYLTDNTQQEIETIFQLLDRYGLEYSREELRSILKIVYPKLYAYLLPFRFKNDLLDNYFQMYKYQKVINKVLPEFDAIVTEQAERRDFNSILEPRSSKIESIDRRGAQLYFIDALGVEYLGFIMSLCREMDMIAYVHVCRCELPSITSRNKAFLEAFADSEKHIISIKDIDEIKHHGKEDSNYQAVKPPIYLSQELSIIEDVIKKIHVQLKNGEYEKAIIASDHGASRLAVIHETENQWRMSSDGIHSGRCCPKSEIDVQPAFAADADDFWALANYDRFKGGRKANFEVHGGATLEEVTIPIIEITKVQETVEVELKSFDTANDSAKPPEILVSYRRKAAMKLFLTKKLQDVSVCINGKYYDAVPTDDNFYSVEMPDIKRAKQYVVDVYACGNQIASGLQIIVKNEGSSEKNLL